MRPLAARSWARNACVTLNAPVRLTAMMSCQSLATASGSAMMALRRAMPALLTRIEIGPSLAATSPATARQALASVTSSGKAIALKPSASISAAVFLRRLGVDVEHGEAGALARKAQRDGAADAGARAGDGGDVGGEEGRHGVAPSLVRRADQRSVIRRIPKMLGWQNAKLSPRLRPGPIPWFVTIVARTKQFSACIRSLLKIVEVELNKAEWDGVSAEDRKEIEQIISSHFQGTKIVADPGAAAASRSSAKKCTPLVSAIRSVPPHAAWQKLQPSPHVRVVRARGWNMRRGRTCGGRFLPLEVLIRWRCHSPLPRDAEVVA